MIDRLDRSSSLSIAISARFSRGFEAQLDNDLVRVQEGFSTRLDAEGESGSRAREDLALGLFSQKKACSAGYLQAAMFQLLLSEKWVSRGLSLEILCFISSFLERRALS